MKKILLTGSTGYIGSHIWVSLIEAGFYVFGIDNFSNSSPTVLSRIKKIVKQNLNFELLDIRDSVSLENLFLNYKFDAVVHLAGLKAVGESSKIPLDYYSNNVAGLINLCTVMNKINCGKLIFSSSATVYGDTEASPLKESSKLLPTNPYGRTKLIGEKFINDLTLSNSKFHSVILRYFNPVGAHKSGLIGENPSGIPNNLMPYISQVASGKLESLKVFGNDYDTPDGTGVRDYIHVLDLADGHIAALNWLLSNNDNLTLNLGTGKGHSVLEVLKTFEKVSNTSIPWSVSSRRAGDIGQYWADPTLAKQILNWQSKYDLYSMCEDTWKWQNNNTD